MTDEGLSIFEDADNEAVETKTPSEAAGTPAPAVATPAAATPAAAGPSHPAPAAAEPSHPAPAPGPVAAAAPAASSVPSFNPASALAGLPMVLFGIALIFSLVIAMNVVSWCVGKALLSAAAGAAAAWYALTGRPPP